MTHVERLAAEHVARSECAVCGRFCLTRYRLEPCLHRMCEVCGARESCLRCGAVVTSVSLLAALDPADGTALAEPVCALCPDRAFTSAEARDVHAAWAHAVGDATELSKPVLASFAACCEAHFATFPE